MKTILLISLAMLSLASCNHRLTMLPKDAIMLIPTDTMDDRPMYSIIKKGKCIMENMYAEEIFISLKQGKWQYNETALVQSH